MMTTANNILKVMLNRKEQTHMVEPLVSIIVPVYNVEAYLEQCLNSPP